MRKIILTVLIALTVCSIDTAVWARPKIVQPQESLLIQEVEAAPNRKHVIEEGLAIITSLDLRSMDIVDTIKFLAVKGKPQYCYQQERKRAHNTILKKRFNRRCPGCAFAH